MVDNIDKNDWPKKAYKNQNFLNSNSAREIRILSEYIEPEARFKELDICDTVVFFGSARTKSQENALKDVETAKANNDNIKVAERNLKMSSYYEDARELAFRLTKWSKKLEGGDKRFILCSGGGPGIMEAANRGASEAEGINIGLNISLPFEQSHNPFITRELNFEFHYFFMRKFWFLYLAKAIVLFPGGFGTMDELFEVLTLLQTEKLQKPLPIILYGSSFWNDVVNLNALVDYGTISSEDLDLLNVIDTVDDAYQFIVKELEEKSLMIPGGVL
ncbi:MAG: TIGR00730 family Rossman fold protein [Pseudomonadota bacterium]|nr:TIGR00730 family Rossman fold protein [Pseudomonadota bacterium]